MEIKVQFFKFFFKKVDFSFLARLFEGFYFVHFHDFFHFFALLSYYVCIFVGKGADLSKNTYIKEIGKKLHLCHRIGLFESELVDLFVILLVMKIQ